MKTLLTLILAVVASAGFSQNTLLVDNTAGAPTGTHVYNDLQSAIDATVPGDIIHVKPSNISYGNAVITEANDSITLFGVGYNPDKEIFLLSMIDQLDIDGSGIRLSGLRITSILDIANNNLSNSISNISVDNCQIDRVDVANGTVETANNIVFRNCILGGGGAGCCSGIINMDADASNVVFNNCIIQTSVTGASPGIVNAQNGTLFTHCLFFSAGGSNHPAFQALTSATVANCTFFGVSPSILSTPNTNNTFTNNLTVNGADTVFTIATGSTSINNIGEDELSGGVFADPDVIFQQYWNKDWQVAFDPASSAQLEDTGNDGTDIGLTGGSIPYKETGTPLPYIKQFIVPSVIKQGNDLPVEISAIGN